jgi:hypothetical protein
MILETERLILSPIAALDVANVHDMNSRESVAMFNDRNSKIA